MTDHRITITSDNSNNTQINIYKVFVTRFQETLINNLLTSDEKKYRIILSGKHSDATNSNVFINKYNLKNNIKFIFKDNNFSKPKILFVKSNNSEPVNNNDLFLFDNSNTFTNKIRILNKEIQCERDSGTDKKNIKFKIDLNFYKNYEFSDYYKFKLSDFSLNNKTYNSINVINNYSNNRLVNTYNSNELSKLSKLYKVINSDTNSDISLVDLNSSIQSSDEFLIYGKSSSNNLTSNSSNNYTELKLDNNDTIYFLPFKKYDYYSNKAGKILFYNNCIHFNSLILDSCSNFYANNQNISPYKYYDTSNTIFLSLGNFMTGFTQKNLFKQTILQHNINNNNININKILFRSLNNNITIPSELSNNYLIEKNDYSFNYIFDNILYNHIDITNRTLKLSSINLSEYYYNYNDLSNNIYLNTFKNLEIQNNPIGTNNYYEASYNANNINFNYSDVCYNNSYTLKLIPDSGSNISNTNNYNLNFDFRYNYDVSFNVSYLVNIDYNNNNINFFKLDFLTNFNITKGSVFNNVEEILIYYDPYSESTPAEFRYPNNNFDICINFQLDFLNTVIENLPTALTSTTNTSFIPKRNGSNISKKMINGLIGLNNVPKLLSIKPYDESILTGRGFNNQLNFQNGTLPTDELQLTEQEKLNRKWNNQKYNSQNNNKVSSKQQFANSVRSSRRIRSRGVNINNFNSGDIPPEL